MRRSAVQSLRCTMLGAAWSCASSTPSPTSTSPTRTRRNARAYAVAGDEERARRYAAAAREAGERIAEADDRELFFSDLVELAR